MVDVQIHKYSDQFQNDWDEFVKLEIGIFLFSRKFINYHKDQFTDHSLLFYIKQKLVAILPATENERRFFSHPGLTFGGILFKEGCKTDKIQAVFKRFDLYLQEQDFIQITYKSLPFWYFKTAEHYFLSQLSFLPSRVLLNHIINLKSPLSFNSVRRREVKKYESEITCRFSQKTTVYYPFLERNLEEKYHTKPLHSFEELSYLTSEFPENIKAYCGYIEEKLAGLIILFVYKNIVKCQYITSNTLGNSKSIIPLMIKNIFKLYHISHDYMDIGTSMTEGDNLNLSLTWFKESMGATPVPIYIFEKQTN